MLGIIILSPQYTEMEWWNDDPANNQPFVLLLYSVHRIVSSTQKIIILFPTVWLTVFHARSIEIGHIILLFHHFKVQKLLFTFYCPCLFDCCLQSSNLCIENNNTICLFYTVILTSEKKSWNLVIWLLLFDVLSPPSWSTELQYQFCCCFLVLLL